MKLQDTRLAAVELTIEDPDQPEIHRLLSASNAYMAALYPAESNHLLDVEALQAANVRFFVARAGGVCAGCGALVLNGDNSAEIKRMWVEPQARGLKLGRRLLEAIETKACRENIAVLRLETGISQPEAIGLYQSAGFRRIGAFGSYLPDALSVFMEKWLT